MKKKTTALLLLLAALLTSAACGNGADTEKTAQTEQNDVQETTTAAETDYLNDVLPNEDFDGKSFRMHIRDRDEYIAEMYIEQADGDIINDAVYERNAAVAEKYNMTFELIKAEDDYGRGADTAITAGEDAYDFISSHGRQSFTYAHAKLMLDWMTDLPYVDLSQPWWNQDAINEFSLGGKLYVGAGDISYMQFGSANGMMFNKKLINNYSLDNPYDLVKNDQWNFDKFTEMALSAVSDLNGDSQIIYTDDILGYGTSWWVGPIQVLYSAEQRVCSNIDGEMTLTLNTPQTATAFEKFFSATTTEGLYIYPSATYSEILTAFIEGRTLFEDMAIRATSYLREMDDDFGIVPWPKVDEASDNYHANVDAGCSTFNVPVTVSDTEFVSLIIEALCYLGHRDVIPTYYDVVLTTKYARDEDSIAMLDIINHGRVFDVGYYYSDSYFGTINSIGQRMASGQNYNFASMYASLESAALQKIEAINEIYAE